MRNCEVHTHSHISLVCTLHLHCNPSVNPTVYSREEPWPLQAMSTGEPASSWRQLTFDKPQSSISPACCCLFSNTLYLKILKYNPQLPEIHFAAVLKYFFYFFLGHAGEAFSHNVVLLSDRFLWALLRAEEKAESCLKYTLEYAPVQQELPCYSWPPTLVRTSICISISAEESSNSGPLFTTTSLYMANVCKCCP